MRAQLPCRLLVKAGELELLFLKCDAHEIVGYRHGGVTYDTLAPVRLILSLAPARPNTNPALIDFRCLTNFSFDTRLPCRFSLRSRLPCAQLPWFRSCGAS